MKNLKSLQLAALAGVAAVLTGCSSTDSAMNEGSNGAYRFVSAGGWVPITDAQKMVAFPPGWVPGNFGPVSYETYRLAPPADADAEVTVASRDRDLDLDADTTTTVTTTEDGTTVSTTFSEDLQPGDTFVEAAGADSNGNGEVRRVILYTPFNSTGIGH